MQLNIDNKKRPIRLIQITDCHLGDQLLGLDTDESLRDVLQLIEKEQPSPDVVMATGDIAGHSGPAAYTRFLELVDQQFATIPMFWLPGNHDSPEVMEASLQGRPMPKVINMGNWVTIMLDSSVPGYEHGDLSENELTFLARALEENADKHTLIFIHHQPVPVGSAWVDQYVVRSAKEFFSIVDRHPQVKGISWGHVHQEFISERNGVTLWATPSTCVQFKPLSEQFTVDRLMPGYRWYDLHEDGRIVTEVSRIEEKGYPINYDSSGY